MDIVLIIFNCYSTITLFLQCFSTTKTKKCFLAACKIWDQNVNLEEVHQNFSHGGLIGYGNSILGFFPARSKCSTCRSHAILQDCTGAVKATTNKAPSYCYMLPQIPISCLLGHITGLFFCIYVFSKY